MNLAVFEFSLPFTCKTNKTKGLIEMSTTSVFGNVKKQELFGMTFPHGFNRVKSPYKIITFL